MNVLFVLEYYPPHVGGVETLFENICTGLATTGHSVSVVTSSLRGTKDFEIVNGVRIYRVHVPNRYLFTLLAIPKVYWLAREVDLIHTTTYNGAFPAWFVSKLRGKKCVITVHEILGSYWKDLAGMGWFSARLHRLLEKLVVLLPFDKYVCVSRYTCNSLRKAGARNEKLEVIYNGVDSGLFSPEKVDVERVKRIRRSLGLDSRFVYTYYGRPGISKGVEYLVQSVPLITRKIPDSKLLLILANDPANRFESIKKMIVDLNIEDRIILIDPVPRIELPDYIAASDCVVVPSLSEGFGYTAAEACAIGKPVVASNVASLPEIVSGRYVFVRPREPRAIAEGVAKVYKGNIEDKGKKVFSWKECIEKYLHVYQEMVGEEYNQ